MAISTDEAYIYGLLVGGGIIHGNNLQINLPYKKWGGLANAARAGQISRDIVTRLNPLWHGCYGKNLSYSFGSDWTITADLTGTSLLGNLSSIGLPISGELRQNATLGGLAPMLNDRRRRRSFINGLVDTIGSMSPTHRRFVSDYQVISFELKGQNYELTKDIATILESIGCIPDQILWNHPNQHAGINRYYKNWKKGFKIRVALDDYMANGSFLFRSKQASASANQSAQSMPNQNTTRNKPVKIQGRVCLHRDQNSSWLPASVRGYQFIHNLHFNAVLGLNVPSNFPLGSIVRHFESYFCPFTCITKGTADEIRSIISSESYLDQTSYSTRALGLSTLLTHENRHGMSSLVMGKGKNDGFPINLVLRAIAFVIAASTQNGMFGQRIRGSYRDYLDPALARRARLRVGVPDRGTCLKVMAGDHQALVGYVNNQFNRTLIQSSVGPRIRIQEPVFAQCVVL